MGRLAPPQHSGCRRSLHPVRCQVHSLAGHDLPSKHHGAPSPHLQPGHVTALPLSPVWLGARAPARGRGICVLTPPLGGTCAFGGSSTNQGGLWEGAKAKRRERGQMVATGHRVTPPDSCAQLSTVVVSKQATACPDPGKVVRPPGVLGFSPGPFSSATNTT